MAKFSERLGYQTAQLVEQMPKTAAGHVKNFDTGAKVLTAPNLSVARSMKERAALLACSIGKVHLKYAGSPCVTSIMCKIQHNQMIGSK